MITPRPVLVSILYFVDGVAQISPKAMAEQDLLAVAISDHLHWSREEEAREIPERPLDGAKAEDRDRPAIILTEAHPWTKAHVRILDPGPGYPESVHDAHFDRVVV